MKRFFLSLLSLALFLPSTTLAMGISPASIDAGVFETGTIVEIPITIISDASAPVEYRVSSPDFPIISSQKVLVSPNDSTTFAVEFATKNQPEGTVTGTLHILPEAVSTESNDNIQTELSAAFQVPFSFELKQNIIEEILIKHAEIKFDSDNFYIAILQQNNAEIFSGVDRLVLQIVRSADNELLRTEDISFDAQDVQVAPDDERLVEVPFPNYFFEEGTYELMIHIYKSDELLEKVSTPVYVMGNTISLAPPSSFGKWDVRGNSYVIRVQTFLQLPYAQELIISLIAICFILIVVIVKNSGSKNSEDSDDPEDMSFI